MTDSNLCRSRNERRSPSSRRGSRLQPRAACPTDRSALGGDYIGVKAKHAVYVPHTAGRRREALPQGAVPHRRAPVNALMMRGRSNGKKLMAVRIVKHTMDIIHLLSDQNPCG